VLGFMVCLLGCSDVVVTMTSLKGAQKEQVVGMQKNFI
jgi:hypothetical protein